VADERVVEGPRGVQQGGDGETGGGLKAAKGAGHGLGGDGWGQGRVQGAPLDHLGDGEAGEQGDGLVVEGEPGGGELLHKVREREALGPGGFEGLEQGNDGWVVGFHADAAGQGEGKCAGSRGGA